MRAARVGLVGVSIERKLSGSVNEGMWSSFGLLGHDGLNEGSLARSTASLYQDNLLLDLDAADLFVGRDGVIDWLACCKRLQNTLKLGSFGIPSHETQIVKLQFGDRPIIFATATTMRGTWLSTFHNRTVMQRRSIGSGLGFWNRGGTHEETTSL